MKVLTHGSMENIEVIDFKREKLKKKLSNREILNEILKIYHNELGIEDLPNEQVEAYLILKPPIRTIIYHDGEDLRETNFFTKQSFIY